MLPVSPHRYGGRAIPGTGRKQKPHTPWETGPRIWRSGRWWRVDLRYLGAGRVTMRNPKDPAWPHAGERTELRDVAERWKWAYVDHYQQKHRERMTGISRPRLIRDALTEYMEVRAGLVARRTARNDRVAVEHVIDDFGNVAVHACDPQRTLSRLLREGYRPYTVQTYSMFLSGFWKWCGLEYRVALPKWQKTEPRVLTDAEIVRVRSEAGALLRPIDCGLYMGLRWGEIFGLEWEDVDLSTWMVRVRRQKGGAPLKSRKTRTAVILPGWTHEPAEGLVCEPVPRERLRAILRRCGLKAKGVGWHTFRHTYARLFLEAKPEMRLLQASLGHSSVRITEEEYNWLLPDRAAELARVAIHGR